ncbi:MAG: phosphoenolpyruvate synthase [Verrucomicrobia bacterium]|jgi:pyruvate,water dikinase|nr:phosphoenolpyruvate synthase [Verrucomicrobiota bacterium]
MPQYLPDSTPGTLAHLGGKGYALTQLAAAGFQVPEWFAVTPAFYRGSTADEASIRQYTFDPGDLDALRQALVKLGGDSFAVRSSAIDEDGAQTSFAGQLDSFLNVPAEAVPERVKQVWLSNFSRRVDTYRSENKIAFASGLPAVIVQRMVAADAAGVAFSVDVITGRWSVALVNAVEGLGEKLVSGEADADGWKIDRDGQIIEHTPSAPGTPSALHNAQAIEVARLARRCEVHFGCPQDIEWALEGDQIHLLQSRPITTLHRLSDPDGTLNIWDNSNIAESYGGVTTPLTYSFAHYIYKEVYQQFCRIMHVPESVLADNRSIFNSMLGLIRGRVYYNLMSWYRMLALLPGFRFNRKFMEQMMGVRESLPESVLAELEDERPGARIKDAGRLAWALVGLVRAQWCLPSMIRDFYAHFDATLKSNPRPLETMRPDELCAHFHTLEEQLLNRWNAPLVNDFFAMIYFGALRSLTEKWCGDADGTLQNGLLCGTGQIISAEPAKRIQKMAKIASEDAEWTHLLCEADAAEIRQRLPQYPDFENEYNTYLARFADRCLNELKLESATLLDDPLPLLRSIGNLARRLRDGQIQPHDIETRLREDSEKQLRKKLSGKPLRTLIFRYVLKNARRRVRDRENLRFERTRLFGRIRTIFLECGKRLASVGALEAPRDVFYLEIYEIIGFIEGTGSTTNLKGLVELRRKEYTQHAETAAPADRFETRGTVPIGHRFEAREKSSKDDPTPEPDGLRGIGCCPGRVRGQARVIIDPSGAHIRSGEILVAEQTDPGWITLFPSAAGVLVERGSLLSHSAIVSREMGIPAIVSIRGLLDRVQTGDWLEFDGQTGIVRKTQAPQT